MGKMLRGGELKWEKCWGTEVGKILGGGGWSGKNVGGLKWEKCWENVGGGGG